jgi:hypothetical protein
MCHRPVKSMDLVIVIVGQMDKWFRVWCTCHSLLISYNMASAAAASFGPNVKVLELNAQMKAVMTIIRSQECSADQFRFYADRIVRFVVESGLAEVPCESNTCPLHTATSLFTLRAGCGKHMLPWLSARPHAGSRGSSSSSPPCCKPCRTLLFINCCAMVSRRDDA